MPNSQIDRLIDHETGEIDRLAISQLAVIKAAQDYGSVNFPPAYLRISLRTLSDRAHSLRLGWLRDRGLPSDEQVVWVDAPAWGCSGDSFAP